MTSPGAARYAVLAVADDRDVTKISPLPAERIAKAVAWLRERHPDRRITIYELLSGEDVLLRQGASGPPIEQEYRVENLPHHGLTGVREVALADVATLVGETPPAPPAAAAPMTPRGVADRDVSALLDRVTAVVLDEFPSGVHSIVLVGSASRELVEASDLDIAVVFRDDAYPRRVIPLRDRLRELAESVAHDVRRDVSLWPSRLDHYVTTFPDVSYVRANLPIVQGRLDAWCGLAKTTLIQYELASAVALHGELDDLRHGGAVIPPWEPPELFLLSTRTLAEGLHELTTPATRGAGRNHVAKALLRAAYAALLTVDSTPRNSYRDIRTAALDVLPAGTRAIVETAYDLKLGGSEGVPGASHIVDFMTLCEQLVSTAPRLRTTGASDGRLAESFHFDADSILHPRVASSKYRRAPGFGVNFYQQAYFLMSAREVSLRLSESASPGAVLDFYAEELLNVASWALFSGSSGLEIPVGSIEPESLTVWFRGPWFARMGGLLSQLARWRLSRRHDRTDNDRSALHPLCLVLSQLAGTPQVPIDPDVLQDLQQVCRDDAARAVDWQTGILSGRAQARMLAWAADPTRAIGS